jgi:hypothetical protein
MSGKSTMKNFKDLLGQAQLPEKTVEICLRGDLVAEFEETERALEQAEEDREKANSLDGGSTVAELARKDRDFRTGHEGVHVLLPAPGSPEASVPGARRG